MRNLVVCCDGTWNTLNNKDQGIPAPTNVGRFYNLTIRLEDKGKNVKTYYNPGVGTSGNKFTQLIGGGLGTGLNDYIKSAYKWLAAEYQPGDNIYLIGFSRGAYTVRSLAGMIGKSHLLNHFDTKLLPAAVWGQVDNAFNFYRDKEAKKPDMKFHENVDIHFLGVWDTVGSLGIPDDIGFLKLFDWRDKYDFHDTVLGKNVKTARHAVALDEKRQSFSPTLWSNKADERVEQIWFPGVHSDVGGGYADNDLADNALKWMLQEAKKAGLPIPTKTIDFIEENPRGLLHDSVDGFFEKLRVRPRQAPFVAGETIVLHDSVIQRQNNPPLSQPHYWRSEKLKIGENKDLTIYAQQQWNNTGLYLEEGGVYSFIAEGEWLDASIKCGPSGTKDGSFQPGEVFHVGLKGLSWFEKGLNLFRKKDPIDFTWSRRQEDLDWFSLIGVVANAKKDELEYKDDKDKHETFLIGDGTSRAVFKSGYLYCFANDAWRFYRNNKGSISLKVERIS